MVATMKYFTLTALILAFWPILSPAQSDGFEPLFSNGTLDGWTLENTQPENFFLDNDVLRVQGEAGWLRSPRPYGEFILRGEIRFVTEDSDSGIFLRVVPGTDFILGWPGNGYQVQIREISVNPSDSPLPLANVYRHRIADGETSYARDRVIELYTGPGQWQQLEIQAFAEQIVVYLNGVMVTNAANIVNPEGYIGFQSEAGLIEYRNMRINER